MYQPTYEYHQYHHDHSFLLSVYVITLRSLLLVALLAVSPFSLSAIRPPFIGPRHSRSPSRINIEGIINPGPLCSTTSRLKLTELSPLLPSFFYTLCVTMDG